MKLMTQKNCNCTSKYCPHYESDFDRYVKENPVVGTQETWREELSEFDMDIGNTAIIRGLHNLVEKVEQDAITRTRLEVRDSIKEIIKEVTEMSGDGIITKDMKSFGLICLKDTLLMPSLQITNKDNDK
jgi:hypothetical protein